MINKKKLRLSVDIDELHYKVLKMCCVELGVSITKFVLEAIDVAIDEYTDRNEKE